MIETSVKFSGFKSVGGLGTGSDSLFRKIEMQRLGEFALKTVIARTKKGIGSDDASMRPLKPGKAVQFARRENGRAKFRNASYAAWKASHGMQPIRDLVGDGRQGGHMLDNPSVRSVSETSVRMAFTSRSARQKALTNEKRTPFFSFSSNDEKAIMGLAEEMFRSRVASLSPSDFLQRKAA